MPSNDNHNNSQPRLNMTMDCLLETQSAPPSPSFKASFRSNRRATSPNLDLPRLKSSTTTATEPIFCCQDCINSIEEEHIDNFGQIGSDWPPFQGSVRFITLDHVIAVVPLTKNPKPNSLKKPIRYYVYLRSVSEYREIDSIHFTYLQDVSGFDEETTNARLTCPKHRQTYNLERYTSPHVESEPPLEYSSESDAEGSSLSESNSSSEAHSPQSGSNSPLEYSSESDTEDSEHESARPSSQPSSLTIEAYGTSTRPLSTYQLSVEKRKFMIRKLSYGRNDQMEEIINTAVILDEDLSRRDRWECQGKKHKKEAQEMLDFEMRYCLGKMRMFFLDGKTC